MTPVTDDLIAAEVDRMLPCRPQCHGDCGGRHQSDCPALLRPAVLALVREQVAAAVTTRDAEWRLSIPVADADAPMTPKNARDQITVAITACEQLAAKKAVAEARRPLVDALRQSVMLQGHYAELLNMHDGGGRIVFRTSQEWLDRLALLAAEKKGGTG